MHHKIMFLSVMPPVPHPFSLTQRQTQAYDPSAILHRLEFSLHIQWISATADLGMGWVLLTLESSLLCCVSLLKVWSCFWHILWFVNCDIQHNPHVLPAVCKTCPTTLIILWRSGSEVSIWMAGNGKKNRLIFQLQDPSKFLPSLTQKQAQVTY